jgi:hypothetical protein
MPPTEDTPLRVLPLERLIYSLVIIARPERSDKLGTSYDVACARARKIERISSAELALASWSRTLRSFKNFAMDARVRRCV